jgi:CRP/FNR family cyclic AMP-dependent transcriptional regulator
VALRKSEKADVLARLPLFEHCTKRDLGRIASVSVQQQFAAGAVLTREGRRGGLAYVLLGGSVTARRAGRKVGALGTGAVVGELSLIDGGTRTATVTADEAVDALVINAGDFRKVVLESPRITLALMRALAGRIRDTDRRGDLRH